MKEISASQIEEAVFHLFLHANYCISRDIENSLHSFLDDEPMPAAQFALKQILDNYTVAKNEEIAICQDTGMALLFAEIGQDVHITGNFNQAVNNGVRKAYSEGYLRASVVEDPLFDRKNTLDNTPAVIHVKIVEGDALKLVAVAKGFGSENCSRANMFIPSDKISVIRDFVVETVKLAGPNSCPPLIIGIGIGGTLEKAALMAKEATIRPVGSHNHDERYANLEREWLKEVNKQGIGPAGLGGRTTTIAVNIVHFATHIASVPVVVNLCCHASRHAERVL